MHDLVIRNARVFDGLGGDALEGSVGVKDGRIAKIGNDVGAGRETVDAEGLALAPGIVDIHTHFDAQLTWDPWATPSVALGVTTVVMGNCGFTIAPCRERDRDRTLRNLTHVEGMSLEALLGRRRLGASRPTRSTSTCWSARAWCRTSPPSWGTRRCAPGRSARRRRTAPRPRPRWRR